MPTPSPDQPPNPSTPPSYIFSTCPEDLPHPPRPGRQPREAAQLDPGEMEVRHSPSADGATPSPSALEPQRPRDGPAVVTPGGIGSQASLEPSSRATTASPRPQSSATAITSPSASGQDGDSLKTQRAGSSARLNQDARSRRLQGGNSAREIDGLDLAVYESECSSPSMGPEYSTVRAIPVSPSSYLRPGSRFHGTQQSERQVYDVQVEIKHVDMRESFLCGYLRIQGLTEDHPTLTTYFEGEIIGTKYSFFTQHEDWGANTKVDLSHWAKFNAFRPFQKHARKGPVTIQNIAQREHIFMRWKEHFLVPDHRVRTITGASFEGFYYICFNQVKGEVSGIYFHSKSEKFQQLELKHVPDRGCFGAMEFR